MARRKTRAKETSHNDIARRDRFVLEYLRDFNATQAAIRAGYSENSAKQIACDLMKKPEVRNAIGEAIDERAERTKIEIDRVVEELALMLFSDIRHYDIDPDGNVKLAEGAPDSAMRAVAGLKKRTRYDKDGAMTIESEFRLWPKDKAAELLGKHLGMYTENFRHDVVMSWADIVRKAKGKK